MTVSIKVADSKKCNGEYSLFISFEFNMEIVNIIKNFPSRYWDASTREWELPLNKLGEFVAMIPWCDIEITGKYVTLEKKKAKIPDGFTFKTTPFEHQVVAFNYGLENNKWLLGDEMGLGKTKEVIDIAVAKKLANGYKHCLIICGVNGLKWNWKNEVATHSNETAHILGQRTKAGRLVIGSNTDKLYDLTHLDDISSYFIVTNVESLRDEQISVELSKLCACNAIPMIAFDECHKAKNPSTQQGKGILKLKAETMIAMTGTPLMNNPFDLYIILRWLGYEKHAFGAFKRHYAYFGGFGGYEVVGYKNLDELQEQLNEIMLRRKKEEVLDLPEKTYIDEMVEMTPKQKQIYNEVTASIKMNIDMIKTAPNPLAELIRMRQATGYTGILSSTIQESAKLDRMEELVEEAVGNDRKVVIFSNWTQMTDAIHKRLRGSDSISKYGFVTITGETKDEERQHKVNEFQNNPDIKIIVGTIGAMGTGLTLTAGSVEIFMDEPWNMALKEQAVDRCYRIGQKNNITIYTLMCENTIDLRIHELVQGKGAMADALVDGAINKQNKGEVVDFLLS